MTAAVFLDRDGVLNDPVEGPEDEHPDAPIHPEDVRIVPGVPLALQRLRAMGYLLVAHSNQPAVALGRATEKDVRDVHERVLELLVARDAFLDDWRYCLHGPDDGCACRKPAPGLLLEAAQEHGIDFERSWVVGDADVDVQAGQAVGSRTVLVEHPHTRHRRTGDATPDAVAPNLEAAAELILGAA